jgi:hypothetical protein
VQTLFIRDVTERFPFSHILARFRTIGGYLSLKNPQIGALRDGVIVELLRGIEQHQPLNCAYYVFKLYQDHSPNAAKEWRLQLH